MIKAKKIISGLALVIVFLNLAFFVFWFGSDFWTRFFRVNYQAATETEKLPIWRFDQTRFIDLSHEPIPTDGRALLADLEQEKKVLTRNLKKGEVTLLAVGDIMLDRGVEQLVNKRGSGDFSFVFENIKNLKGEADILLGNLEGPVSDQGTEIGNLYSFRMSPVVLPVLKKVGFDILTVANNHAGDWGVDAFVDSLKRLTASEFPYVGGGLNKAEAEKPVIIEKSGLRVGFLGFSDVGPKWLEATEQGAGILNVDDSTFAEIIAQAAKQSDALVVTIHFGEEYQPIHNDRQEKLAKMALGAGATVVIGHHPHVVQDDEQIGNQYIAYSLGNFVFDQNFSVATMEGLALKLKLSKDGVIGVEKLPIKINESFQPSFK